jgi:FAD synthase
VRRLRAEQKFADLAALQAQIALDSAQARETLGLQG